MKTALLSCFCLIYSVCAAQDTTILFENRKTILPEVFVRNHFDYKRVLQQIKEDTTFYKSFKNLRILNYTAYNHIQLFDKKGSVEASLQSKTQQFRAHGCRTMKVLEETTTGNMYTNNHEWNYFTAQLYASLFFTKGEICGETNIVKGNTLSASGKKGLEKHKEQLKMLFFNPGRKIPGIPFIGNKLDLYDDRAEKHYNYQLNITEYKGKECYSFAITPKLVDDSGESKSDWVIDEMITWFDKESLAVFARNYRLSYKAGVYDFDVQMEVEMDRIGDMIVPKVLRYKGNWGVIFKKRERAQFTATLFDFSKEKN